MKEDVVMDVYEDKKFQRSINEKRTIYTDTKGRYIKEMGNKRYLDDKNHWKSESFSIGPGMTFLEMIEDVKKKNEEAYQTHLKNGGMCQNCGKNKAEYPNGLNPFNCSECNAVAHKLLNGLSKDPGFMAFQVG